MEKVEMERKCASMITDHDFEKVDGEFSQ